jgi:hypothetical protein
MKELGPEATRLLRDGDRFDPPASARDRVQGALTRRLATAVAVGVVAATEAVATGAGSAAAGAGAGAGAMAGWLAAPLTKIIGVVVIGGGIAGGAWGLARVTASTSSPASHSRSAASVVAPHSRVDSLRSPAIARDVIPSPPRLSADAAPVPAVALQPAPRRGRPAVARAAPPAGEHGRPSEAKTSATSPAVSSPLPLLGAEASLLRQVQTARTSGDASLALALLQRYAETFPAGAMVDVARAEQVLTLCALGRDAEARAIARRLPEDASTSPLTARINQSCARQIP